MKRFFTQALITIAKRVSLKYTYNNNKRNILLSCDFSAHGPSNAFLACRVSGYIKLDLVRYTEFLCGYITLKTRQAMS